MQTEEKKNPKNIINLDPNCHSNSGYEVISLTGQGWRQRDVAGLHKDHESVKLTEKCITWQPNLQYDRSFS